MIPIHVSRIHQLNLNIPIKLIIVNLVFFFIFLNFENYFGGDGISNFNSTNFQLNELYCIEHGGCFRDVLLKKLD